MTANKENLAKFLSLIKRAVKRKIKDPSHYNIRDDVIQEVFLKLLKNNFFDQNDFDDDQNNRAISHYINRTVNSCYMDQLKQLGYNRRLTMAERENRGSRYENIVNEQIGDVAGTERGLLETKTPDQYAFVKEAYQWIKHCFERFSAGIDDLNKKKFFQAAFWQLDDYRLPIKKLAEQLGYTSANPTRDLKSFISRVSHCTEPHGVVVTNPSEQIQFLLERIEDSEVMS